MRRVYMFASTRRFFSDELPQRVKSPTATLLFHCGGRMWTAHSHGVVDQLSQAFTAAPTPAGMNVCFELFCGFARDDYPEPVAYPASCSPQAWAAATPLSLLRTILRFDPSLPTGDVWIAPTSADVLGDIHLRNVPFAGTRIALDTSSIGTSVTGLPAGVTLHHEPRPAAGVPTRREPS